MTQITIAQWLSHNTQSEVNMTLPRYQIVASNRFYGHFDVLDTRTGKREPCGNLRTARATLKDLQSKQGRALVTTSIYNCPLSYDD